MHYVFYPDLEINKPMFTGGEGRLKEALGLEPADLITGRTFRYRNILYEIESTTPAKNTSPYYMESLLVRCKAL